jgi:hypothetical protein
MEPKKELMKPFILIPIIFIAQIGWSQTNHKQQEVVKVEPKEKNCIEIPSSFSHETIYESKSLGQLQSKKITRVELIYTRFKENPDFDQVQLNEDRMYRLQQLLPRLKTDHPEIIWIEQTGAETREEAANYFHGFRLYTGGESTKNAFARVSREDKSNPSSMFTIDNSLGGTFSHPSGTQIHIPADAVVYEDGNKVIGTYTFSYHEYRNPAEMVFSGIPMTYSDKTGNYQFNSAGMYEIRGTKDGKSLKLQKDVAVDFNCTKKEADINFYQMDDKSGEWTVLNKDLFNLGNHANPVENGVVNMNRIKRDSNPEDETRLSWTKTKPYSTITLREDTRKAYRNLIKKEPQKIQESVAQDLSDNFELKVRPEYVEALVQLILDETRDFDNEMENQNNTLIGGIDKGHQYPNLVRGLNSPEFGVYNCDQIYRVENQIAISPKYLDSSTKKQIKKQDIVCLIDKEINASFSFDPSQITCNSKGKNIFLLFTDSGEIYAFQTPIDLTKKEPVFQMENITGKIKTSEDLKQLLSI